jgi:LEA14-like dessication related protein
MKKIVIALVLPALFLSCAALQNIMGKKPEVSLKRFDIDSISLKDITFRFDIELTNPYPIGFTLDDVGFNVKIEGNQLLKTRTKKGVTVRAGGSEITSVTVKLVYEDIIRLIKDYTERDYLNCAIDINIVIPLPEMIQSIKKNIAFDYTVQKKIPAMKPTFKLANLQVKAPTMDEIKSSLAETGKKNLDPVKIFNMFDGLISGKGTSAVTDSLDLTSLDIPIDVSFDVEVKNNTRAQLKCREMTYDFLVSDANILKGTTGNILNDGNRSVIRIANTFSSKAMGKAVINMLKNREGQYQIKGFSSVKFPDDIKTEPLRLDFDEKGLFKLK